MLFPQMVVYILKSPHSLTFLPFTFPSFLPWLSVSSLIVYTSGYRFEYLIKIPSHLDREKYLKRAAVDISVSFGTFYIGCAEYRASNIFALLQAELLASVRHGDTGEYDEWWDRPNGPKFYKSRCLEVKIYCPTDIFSDRTLQRC